MSVLTKAPLGRSYYSVTRENSKINIPVYGIRSHCTDVTVLNEICCTLFPFPFHFLSNKPFYSGVFLWGTDQYLYSTSGLF